MLSQQDGTECPAGVLHQSAKRPLKETSAALGTAEATPPPGGHQKFLEAGLFSNRYGRTAVPWPRCRRQKAKTPPGEAGFSKKTAVGGSGGLGDGRLYSPE